MRIPSPHSRRPLRLVALTTVMALALTGCFVRPHDYDGDKTADVVYIVATGTNAGAWVQDGVATPLWAGMRTDVNVGGDYDNDGKWEPAELQGRDWYSSKLAAPIHYDPVGLPTAYPEFPNFDPANPITTGAKILPVPADYDGDGDTDPAYYAVVDGTWWIQGRAGSTQYGTPPNRNGHLDWDVPVPADYDGDLKADIAVFHPTDHSFHILQSKTGTERVVRFSNIAALMPVVADYDGDGKADPAVSNTTGTAWWLTPDTATPTYVFTSPTFATANGYPVVADYDGDKKADLALYDMANHLVRARIGGVETHHRHAAVGHGRPARVPAGRDRQLRPADLLRQVPGGPVPGQPQPGPDPQLAGVPARAGALRPRRRSRGGHRMDVQHRRVEPTRLADALLHRTALQPCGPRRLRRQRDHGAGRDRRDRQRAALGHPDAVDPARPPALHDRPLPGLVRRRQRRLPGRPGARSLRRLRPPDPGRRTT